MSDISTCYNFKEHPNWMTKNPARTGVTWDGWCSLCGFRLENKSFDSGGLSISGNGRKLAHVCYRVCVNEKWFTSDEREIHCSKCSPCIMEQSHD